MYKAAITLAEAGMGTFDECVNALRLCNSDENAALMMLVDKKKEEASLYDWFISSFWFKEYMRIFINIDRLFLQTKNQTSYNYYFLSYYL